MTKAANFYDRSLTRIVRIAIVLGLVGTIVTLVQRGTWIAVGFLTGTILSLINFSTLRHLAEGLEASGTAPMRGSALFFGLRYLILGGVVYVIVKVLGISLMAILAGLFVSAAAVIVEILYELVFSR
jgi:hypothetical protein